MENNIEKPQTSWNLSEWKTNLIGSSMVRANKHYTHKKYGDCFDEWESIRMIISDKLSTKQNNFSKKWEDVLKDLIVIPKPKPHGLPRVFYTKKYQKGLKIYISLINEYLKNIGMGISEKKQREHII